MAKALSQVIQRNEIVSEKELVIAFSRDNHSNLPVIYLRGAIQYLVTGIWVFACYWSR